MHHIVAHELLSHAAMRRSEHGFSLVETLVAVSLLAVGVSALAQVAVAAARASAGAQRADAAQLAARDKLEQLRALTFISEADGMPATDTTSDLSVTPQAATGGSGLAISGDTLLSNVAGYCDFLDADGAWLAGGTRPPSRAVWVRRWSIQAIPGLPDSRLLQVVILPAHIVQAASVAAHARTNNGAWLVDIRTRTRR